MKTAQRNPYVGPRAFRTGETLFGRDAEVRRLFDLLIAERIVLLHSPSGAGKTSLIQAGLIPLLREEGFHVWPPLRVAAPLPHDAPSGTNRYLASVLCGLESTVQQSSRCSLDEAIGRALSESLGLPIDESSTPRTRPPQVLVLDQFEEVVRIDPADLAAKEEFFHQLGVALRAADRWALFAIREEFIGRLDPWTHHLPTRLGCRFRLDLLGEAAARDAIRKPAAAEGVTFHDEATRRMVDDLRRVTVPREDGTYREEPGLYVEPVQLQIVARRLWQRLPEGATTIDPELAGDAGAVDDALAGYYADHVAEAARKASVPERDIRSWVGSHMIVQGRIRTQVLRGPDLKLPSAAIQHLVDEYILREEERRGLTWIELAHDRLIGPICRNNEEWRRLHMVPLQVQAELWLQKGKPDALLPRASVLKEAEAWAAKNPSELNDLEREYLASSLKARRGKRLAASVAVLATLFVTTTLALALLLSRQRLTEVELENVKFSRENNFANLSLQRAEARAQKAQEDLDQKESSVLAREIESNRRLPSHRPAPSAQPSRRSTYRVEYFTRDANDRAAAEALGKLGFKVHEKESRLETPTNSIWFGSEVPHAEVEAITLTLAQAGIAVKDVKKLPRKAPLLVQIGTQVQLVDKPVLSAKSLESAQQAPDVTPDIEHVLKAYRDLSASLGIPSKPATQETFGIASCVAGDVLLRDGDQGDLLMSDGQWQRLAADYRAKLECSPPETVTGTWQEFGGGALFVPAKVQNSPAQRTPREPSSAREALALIGGVDRGKLRVLDLATLDPNAPRPGQRKD